MPVRYPVFNTIPINNTKPAYGYPKGTHGRAYTPVIIVLHWLGEEYEGYLAQGQAPSGGVNMSQFRHPMMHYIIGQDGYIARMALPTDDAWSIMNVQAPSFTLPYPYPSISPNRYTINIGIESGSNVASLTGEYLNAPTPTITPTAWRKLVGVIGMECDRWGITPSVTTIRSHEDFDTTDFSWCGANIDYFKLANEVAAWLLQGGEPCQPRGAPACEYECGGCQEIDGAKLYYGLPAGSILQVAPNGCGLVAASLPPVLDNCSIAALIPLASPLVPQTNYIAIGANGCLVRAPLPPALTPCTFGALIETGTGVALLTLDGNNCIVRENDIACFMGANIPFDPVLNPTRWIGVDDENCLRAFTPPSPITPCDIGAQMGSASTISFYAVLDDDECLSRATTAQVACDLGNYLTGGIVEAEATQLVGIGQDGCLVAVENITPCTLGNAIPAGAALSYVGLDSNNCLVSFTPPPDVSVTPCSFGAAIGVVLDYQPEYVIALDENNCLIAVNYPTLDGGLNPCTLGAVIPTGTITQFVGLNNTNCLVKGSLNIPPCFDPVAVSGVIISPNLVTINNAGCLRRISAPTYNGYLGIDSSGNYLNKQGVPLLKCNDTVPNIALPNNNARILAMDGTGCISTVTNGGVGTYLGINGSGQMAWLSFPAPTRCTIGALATVGTAVSWLGVDNGNCLVKFTPPTLPSITPCSIGGLITGGTPTRWVGLDAGNCLVFFTPPTIPTAPTACTIGALANANINPAVKMVGLDSSNCLTTSNMPLFAVAPANAGIFVTSGTNVGLRIDPATNNSATLTANGLFVPAQSTSLVTSVTSTETQTTVGVVIDSQNNLVIHQLSLTVSNPSSYRPMNVLLNFSQGGVSGLMYPDQGVRRVMEIDTGGGSFAAFSQGDTSDFINGDVNFPAPYSTSVRNWSHAPYLQNTNDERPDYNIVDSIPASGSKTYRMRSVVYAIGAGGASSQVIYYPNKITAIGVTQ